MKVLFEENTILDEENKRLKRQLHKDRQHPGSGEKHASSASAKVRVGPLKLDVSISSYLFRNGYYIERYLLDGAGQQAKI